MLLTVLIGVTGGVFLAAIGVPAGGLIGAVFAVGGYSLIKGKAAKLPLWVRLTARIVMGTVIGSMLTRELVSGLGTTIAWSFVFTFVMLGVGVLSGYVLAAVTGFDLRTSLMATCPGGMSELTLLSDQLGTDTEIVLGVQLVRKVLTLIGAAAILIGLQVWG